MADRRVDALARAIGVRDLALGLGAFVALKRDLPARGWFEAAALCDAVDAVATLIVFRELPRQQRWAVVAAAITGGCEASAARAIADRRRNSTKARGTADRARPAGRLLSRHRDAGPAHGRRRR